MRGDSLAAAVDVEVHLGVVARVRLGNLTRRGVEHVPGVVELARGVAVDGVAEPLHPGPEGSGEHCGKKVPRPRETPQLEAPVDRARKVRLARVLHAHDGGGSRHWHCLSGIPM